MNRDSRGVVCPGDSKARGHVNRALDSKGGVSLV